MRSHPIKATHSVCSKKLTLHYTPGREIMGTRLGSVEDMDTFWLHHHGLFAYQTYKFWCYIWRGWCLWAPSGSLRIVSTSCWMQSESAQGKSKIWGMILKGESALNSELYQLPVWLPLEQESKHFSPKLSKKKRNTGNASLGWSMSSFP